MFFFSIFIFSFFRQITSKPALFWSSACYTCAHYTFQTHTDNSVGIKWKRTKKKREWRETRVQLTKWPWNMKVRSTFVRSFSYKSFSKLVFYDCALLLLQFRFLFVFFFFFYYCSALQHEKDVSNQKSMYNRYKIK